MTKKEFQDLKPGDVVRGGYGLGYIVSACYDDYVICVRTVHMTNPAEWERAYAAYAAEEAEGGTALGGSVLARIVAAKLTAFAAGAEQDGRDLQRVEATFCDADGRLDVRSWEWITPRSVE